MLTHHYNPENTDTGDIDPYLRLKHKRKAVKQAMRKLKPMTEIKKSVKWKEDRLAKSSRGLAWYLKLFPWNHCHGLETHQVRIGELSCLEVPTDIIDGTFWCLLINWIHFCSPFLCKTSDRKWQQKANTLFSVSSLFLLFFFSQTACANFS